MRPRAKFFEFTSYNFEPKKKRVSFRYKIGFTSKNSIVFTETVMLPKIPRLQEIPKGVLNNVLQSLHLVLGVSYYKLYCPSEIKLKESLSKEQSNFWQTLYRKGLGEFFYRNNLNPKIVKFPHSKKSEAKSYKIERQGRTLVAVGGGKDSIVAVELLKREKHKITGFVLETQKKSKIIDNVLKQSEISCLKIRRLLDKKLLEYLPDTYQGHIPISAIYAFFGLMSAIFYDFSNIIVSNEYSSNFGNIIYKDEVINHQWSKSFEFEELFQNYIEKYITPDIHYFSILRPFYEIRIVKLFSQFKRYFPYFSSCNRNFTIKKKEGTSLWCNKCPKCVFLFLLLSAFLPKKQLLTIFGKNLYTDKELLPMFSNLLGFGKLKPFDCIGTFEEAQTAMYLARNKFRNDFIIKILLPKIKITQQTIKKVFSTNSALNIPVRFRFVGMNNILILGYGKEGKISEQYLKRKFPKKKIGIADQSKGANYLKRQQNYDIAVRTPGISKKNLTIQYTTATNLFFSQVKNKIIGITGSKGKSTTTSLIYQILKKGGKKVRLLGNIGKPMLGTLMVPIKKAEIFVLELSSYQLDDIEFSPNVAVITNLFPEHMNYHGGIENYYEAKKNILKFQKQNDFFVFNPKVKKLINWAKQSNARAVPFNKKIPLHQSEIPLLGEHNKDNIKAAIAVAKLFGIENKKIKQAIKEFKPLPHRLEFIGEFKGIKFYDDAISTTPQSTIMAIRSIPKIGTIFLGGKDRGYDFSELERIIRKCKIKNVVLFPDSGKRIFQNKTGLNILKTSKMKKAVEFAYQNATKGTVCLLSTASPSYSLWKNFEEQGEEFQLYVKQYGKKKSSKKQD